MGSKLPGSQSFFRWCNHSCTKYLNRDLDCAMIEEMMLVSLIAQSHAARLLLEHRSSWMIAERNLGPVNDCPFYLLIAGVLDSSKPAKASWMHKPSTTELVLRSIWEANPLINSKGPLASWCTIPPSSWRIKRPVHPNKDRAIFWILAWRTNHWNLINLSACIDEADHWSSIQASLRSEM